MATDQFSASDHQAHPHLARRDELASPKRVPGGASLVVRRLARRRSVTFLKPQRLPVLRWSKKMKEVPWRPVEACASVGVAGFWWAIEERRLRAWRGMLRMRCGREVKVRAIPPRGPARWCRGRPPSSTRSSPMHDAGRKAPKLGHRQLVEVEARVGLPLSGVQGRSRTADLPIPSPPMRTHGHQSHAQMAFTRRPVRFAIGQEERCRDSHLRCSVVLASFPPSAMQLLVIVSIRRGSARPAPPGSCRPLIRGGA